MTNFEKLAKEAKEANKGKQDEKFLNAQIDMMIEAMKKVQKV